MHMLVWVYTCRHPSTHPSTRTPIHTHTHVHTHTHTHTQIALSSLLTHTDASPVSHVLQNGGKTEFTLFCNPVQHLKEVFWYSHCWVHKVVFVCWMYCDCVCHSRCGYCLRRPFTVTMTTVTEFCALTISWTTHLVQSFFIYSSFFFRYEWAHGRKHHEHAVAAWTFSHSTYCYHHHHHHHHTK